jgi:hypothetical protein
VSEQERKGLQAEGCYGGRWQSLSRKQAPLALYLLQLLDLGCHVGNQPDPVRRVERVRPAAWRGSCPAASWTNAQRMPNLAIQVNLVGPEPAPVEVKRLPYTIA